MTYGTSHLLTGGEGGGGKKILLCKGGSLQEK